MESILEICEWCADTFGLTLAIILFLIFLPVIVAIAMLLFVLAVPVGVIYGLYKMIKES